MLYITQHKNNHIELHLGAYFRGFISTFSGLMIAGLAFSIILILAKDLIQQEVTKFLTIFILLVFIGVFVNLFMGIEGIEFDLEKRLYRKYVKRLGFKIGVWKDLKPYSLLCLSAQYNSGSNPSSSTSIKHRSLEINLASLDKKAILLAECKNYKEASKALEKLNHYLQLEIKDFVKEHYMKINQWR